MSVRRDSEGPAAGPARRCLRAWAKVNLYLHVTGQRPDGYHEVDSLIAFAGIGDRVEIAAADGLDLWVTGPGAAALPGGEENLAYRAARALSGALSNGGVERGARIELEKHLPVAAGLGGGSADAAAVLAGLAALWQADLSTAKLREIALGLGADVPVCLFGRPAFVGGIGEVIERAPPLPPAWLLLVNPGVALATAEVFAARRGAVSEPGRWADTVPDLPALAERLTALGNDLEAPARALAPEVDEALGLIGQLPAVRLTRMSGSGATCFGLFAGRDEAQAAAAVLTAERPDWWIQVAALLHGPLDRLRAPPAPAP